MSKEYVEYITTKEQCELHINGRVCSYCGEPLSAIETVDNSDRPTHWLGCKSCGRFNTGTTTRIYNFVSKQYRYKDKDYHCSEACNLIEHFLQEERNYYDNVD